MLAMPSSSGVAEAASATRAALNSIDFDNLGPDDRGEDELRDPIATPNDHRIGPEVDYNNMDFATIIGVDGAGRIDQRQPLTEGATAARTHLPLKTRRYLECNSSRYRNPL